MSFSGKMNTIKIDRGLELNKFRLSEDFVDVHFIVEGTRIPAHRLIVSLHSDYLKALTDPSSGFIESNQNEYTIQGISLKNFNAILNYIYTGSITIRGDNVFDLIESAFFLQMDMQCDVLVVNCFTWLQHKLENSITVDIGFVIKVWNACLTYGTKPLKEIVLRHVECRLERLIQDNLLSFLSFEDVQEILCRPTLCIRSEKNVCDAIMKWIEDKRCPDATDNEDDNECTLRLIQECRNICTGMPDTYFQNWLARFNLPNSPLPDRGSESTVKPNCESCLYICLWNKLDEQIRPVDHFTQNRINQQELILNHHFIQKLATGNRFEVSVEMVESPSFYQHYGPIGRKHGKLLATDAFIFYMGGSKINPPGSKPNVNDIITDEINVYDIQLHNWIRMSTPMPRRLIHFGAVSMKKYIYIIGGFTDDTLTFSPDVPSKKVTIEGVTRKLAISTSIYYMNVDKYFDSKNEWTKLCDLPEPRTAFSVVTVDDRTLCVVGPDYCDVLDTDTCEWRSVEQTSDFWKNSKEAPAVANIGSVLYIVNPRKKGKDNTIWTIDLLDEPQPSWKKLENPLKLSYDPRHLFVHNGCLYLIGDASEDGDEERKNVCFEYDRRTKKWENLHSGFTGQFTPNSGVFVRKQLVKDYFFGELKS